MSLRVPLSSRQYANHSIVQEESTTTAPPLSATSSNFEISSGQLFIAAVFFLIIPIVAFVLLGGVQKVKKLLGYDVKGKARAGKYSRLEDLEK
jgi:hypothetical protein